MRASRALAGCSILGGALIAVGSQWRLTPTGDAGWVSVSAWRGVAPLTSQVTMPFPHIGATSWVLPLLVACGLVVASLATAVTVSSRRPRWGWLFPLAVALVAAYVGYLGNWMILAASAVGPGYVLVAAGSGGALACSVLWSLAVRRASH